MTTEGLWFFTSRYFGRSSQIPKWLQIVNPYSFIYLQLETTSWTRPTLNPFWLDNASKLFPYFYVFWCICWNFDRKGKHRFTSPPVSLSYTRLSVVEGGLELSPTESGLHGHVSSLWYHGRVLKSDFMRLKAQVAEIDLTFVTSCYKECDVTELSCYFSEHFFRTRAKIFGASGRRGNLRKKSVLSKCFENVVVTSTRVWWIQRLLKQWYFDNFEKSP